MEAEDHIDPERSSIIDYFPRLLKSLNGTSPAKKNLAARQLSD